jgi:hypothetical protein
VQSPADGARDVPRGVPVSLIVGAPRSGTSLLYKLLCLHRDAAYVSNWTNRFGFPSVTAWANRVATHDPVRRRAVWFVDGDNAYVYGRRRKLLERAFPAPVEGHWLFSRVGATFPDQPGQRGTIDPARLRKQIDTIVRAGGGSVFISKRVINNWYLDQIDAALPHAHYVHVLRDGRSVAASLLRVNWWEDNVVPWWGGTPEQWRAEGRDPWELAATTWVKETTLVDEFLAKIPEERRLTVRYEDVLADPTHVLDDVACFAGLGADSAWTDEIATMRFPQDRVRAWETSLDDAAQQTVTNVQAPLLAQHGYR